MTEKERIDFLIKHLAHGNGKVFAEKIGVSPASVSRMRTETNGISHMIPLILDRFPQVRREWLESGEGYPGDITIELVKEKYERKVQRLEAIIDKLIYLKDK